MTPPDNPFAGQGGSYYINPNGSNTLKRNRNDVQPFSTLTNEEKYKRLVAVPAGAITERDRAERIASLGLTAEQIASLNSSLAASTSADPAAANAAAGKATDAPATGKKGGK